MNSIVGAIADIKYIILHNPLWEKIETRSRMKADQLQMARIERKREIDALILRALELCKDNMTQKKYISYAGAYFDREKLPRKCEIDKIREFLENVGITRLLFPELFLLLLPA